MIKLFPLLLLFAFFVSPVNAETVIFTTGFDGADGATPTGFVLQGATTTSQLSISGNNYRAATGANLTSVYEPDASVLNLNDYSVSSNFRIGGYTSGGYAGLLAYFQDATHYYQARLFATATANTWQLQIYKTDGTATLLGSSTAFSYTAGETWELSFTAGDGLLSAMLYNASDAVVASVLNVADTTFSSGTAGVRATVGGGNAVVYEDFTISAIAIPEPSSLTFFGCVLGIAAAHIFRRRTA